MLRNKKGFTLIEMLVVIGIIAILVAIVVPVISSATDKAAAATDAANLRTILGELNIHCVNGNKTIQEILNSASNPVSRTDPEAVLQVVFEDPGFIDVYYVNGDTYYGLDYLSDVATYGSSELSTGVPDVSGTWYTVTG